MVVDEYQPKEAFLVDQEDKAGPVEGEKAVLTWDDLKGASKNVEIVQVESGLLADFTAYEK